MRTFGVLAGLIVAWAARGALAQTVWDVFNDDVSGSACGLVNTVNNELVVLSDTAQLMIVSRRDTILADTVVDPEGFVTFEGDPAGVIDFAEDADGFRTLWWLTLDGQIVQLDPFSAAPSSSGQFPEDIGNVPCDACEFVDSPPGGVCATDTGTTTNPLVPVILNFCGNGLGSGFTLAMALAGFLGLRFYTRRGFQPRVAAV